MVGEKAGALSSVVLLTFLLSVRSGPFRPLVLQFNSIRSKLPQAADNELYSVHTEITVITAASGSRLRRRYQAPGHASTDGDYRCARKLQRSLRSFAGFRASPRLRHRS